MLKYLLRHVLKQNQLQCKWFPLSHDHVVVILSNQKSSQSLDYMMGPNKWGGVLLVTCQKTYTMLFTELWHTLRLRQYPQETEGGLEMSLNICHSHLSLCNFWNPIIIFVVIMSNTLFFFILKQKHFYEDSYLSAQVHFHELTCTNALFLLEQIV